MTSSHEIAAMRKRVLPAPPLLVWALASDTNRWDRIVGFGPTTYQKEAAGPEPGDGMRRVGHAEIAGMATSWVEKGEWIEGEYMRGERHFLTGPMVLGGLELRLAAEAGGARTAIEARTYSVPRLELPDGVVEAIRRSLEKSLDRYLNAIERVLATGMGGSADAAEPAREPAVTVARRVALRAEPDAIHAGKTSTVADAHFGYCAQRFEAAPVDPGVRARVLSFLRGRSDDEVRQMRPYEIARAWDVDRREALRGFLHAARAGLVDLRWQLNCPTCRVGAAAAESLGGVGGRAHCDVCDIDFAVDFASNVEAVFQVNAAIRPVDTQVYCAGSPWFRPHVFALLSLEPRARRTVTLALPWTALALRTLAGRRLTPLPGTPAPPDSLEVHVRGGAIEVAAPSGGAGAGERTSIVLHNDTDGEAAVLVEWADRDADLVLGSEITSMPDFLDLFSTEAPATGANISVGAITVLFSDLSATTELYQRLGDARAFAFVQEHFRAVGAIVAFHGGAVVKTMGDAIMASFAAPPAAVAAALDMVDETRAALRVHGIGLKIGLHSGPCLAVRANARLDYFGTTVNLASRLQALAGPGQVTMLAELLRHPGVDELVRARGKVLAHYPATLKGLAGAREMVAIDA
jgi:class 3 adenylate cyclase